MRALLAAALLCAGSAQAAEGPWARIADGAPMYAALRPAAFLGLLKRLGVGELPDVKALKGQLMGMDPLDPVILSPSGLDPAAPIVVSGFAAHAPGLVHFRVVATLAERTIFQSFLGGLAMAGQLPLTIPPPGSPLAAGGVVAHGLVGKQLSVVARIVERELVVDAVLATSDAARAKLPAAAALLRTLPLVAKRALAADKGARRLLTDEPALALYLDGRKLPAIIDAVSKLGKQPQAAGCDKLWANVWMAFDDVGVSLQSGVDELKLNVAWGVQLGKLPIAFRPSDDHAFDVDLLSRQAPVLLVSYDAGSGPVSHLKHTGPLATVDTLRAAVKRCPAQGYGYLAARAWPQAVTALLGNTANADPIVGRLMGTIGSVRNGIAGLRDWNGGARWLLGATLRADARPTVDGLIGLLALGSGGGGQPWPLGKRTPTLYELGPDGEKVAVAVDTVDNGALAVGVADSKDTLQWSLRTQTRVTPDTTPARRTPVAALFADTAALAGMAPLWASMNIAADDVFVQFLRRLRRLDAELTQDDNLLRVTTHSPLK